MDFALNIFNKWTNPPIAVVQPVEEEEKPEEEPEEELSEADLPRLQAEVNDLQQAFDQAVVEKHSLHMELQSMNERLKAASEMVERWASFGFRGYPGEVGGGGVYCSK